MSAGERLSPVDLHARLWSAEDRILRVARHLSAVHNLDPAYVERMESACLHGDQAAFERTLGEMLDEITAKLD